MEKKFRIKSIIRETENKTEYLEDYTDCIITVEEVDDKKGLYFKEEIYIDKESGGEVIIHEIDVQSLGVYDSVTKEPIAVMNYSRFYLDYYLKKDKIRPTGQDKPTLISFGEPWKRCWKVSDIKKQIKDLMKDNPKETLTDIFIHYWEDTDRIGYKNDMGKLAELAQDYLKKNPNEIDCVPAIRVKELNEKVEKLMAVDRIANYGMVSKDKYDVLIEKNSKLANQLIKKRNDYNKGFEDGFNSKKPKDNNHLFDIESIIEALKKEKDESYPFDYLIWYLKSSMKGMVSHKKVMEEFDKASGQKLNCSNVNKVGLSSYIRIMLQNMEKK